MTVIPHGPAHLKINPYSRATYSSASTGGLTVLDKATLILHLSYQSKESSHGTTKHHRLLQRACTWEIGPCVDLSLCSQALKK